MPAAASQSAETASGGSAVPVGLLGLGSSTTLGCCSAIRSRAWSRSREKSVSRCPTTQSVTESRAYSGYIEYVGAKLSARRPGPPKAWSSWSITSLDPLAAHTCSGEIPCGASRERYAASASRSAVNSRSG